MKFGSNTNINYVRTINQLKKVQQEVPSSHLETLEKEPKISKTVSKIKTFEEPKEQQLTFHNNLENLGEHRKQILNFYTF